METFILYVAEWAFALTVFIALYKLCFSNATFHRFNRMVLLAILLISAVLPLAKCPLLSLPDCMQTSTIIDGFNESYSYMQSGSVEKTDTYIDLYNISLRIITLLYILYVAAMLVGWVRFTLRMRRFTVVCSRRFSVRWAVLALHNSSCGALSWMNYIIISRKEKGVSRRISILHEAGHVFLLHFVDLMLVNCCMILNPIAWLVLREIKMVHEYEADAYAVRRSKISPKQYQLQLLKISAGAEAYALASSFNFKIKKRIIMMKKKKTKSLRKVALLLFLLVSVFLSFAFADSSTMALPVTPSNVYEAHTTVSDEQSDSIIITVCVNIFGEYAYIDAEGNIHARNVTLKDISDEIVRRHCSSQDAYIKVQLQADVNAPRKSIEDLKSTLRKTYVLSISYEEKDFKYKHGR